MAYKKKSTRGVKSPALVKAEKQIAALTGKLEASERENAELKHSASYWEKRAAENQINREQSVAGRGFEAGKADTKEGVIITAAIRAHMELMGVKAQEQNFASLQRILGSVQGGLGVALEMAGRLGGGHIDLYPDDENAKRTLDAVRNTINHHGRY